MTAETLAAFVGVALSLAFSYIPGLKDKFGALEPQQKQMWMGVMLFVAAGVIVGIGCAGISPVVVCTQAGLIEFGGTLVAALVANQATFLISPKA